MVGIMWHNFGTFVLSGTARHRQMKFYENGAIDLYYMNPSFKDLSICQRDVIASIVLSVLLSRCTNFGFWVLNTFHGSEPRKHNLIQPRFNNGQSERASEQAGRWSKEGKQKISEAARVERVVHH